MPRHADPIPTFLLYGEAPGRVDDHFLHLESLDHRSRPANWRIRPHCHANLHQVFFITSGGGEMVAESCSMPMRAPCLLFVPSSVVHSFTFQPETRGTVVTLADAYLTEIVLRSAELAALFAAAGQVAVTSERFVRVLRRCFARLERELAENAPGQAAAVEAELLSILVCALRLGSDRLSAAPARGADAKLVARFRTIVESRFRSNAALPVYLDQLATPYARLHAACMKVVARTPLQVIRERVLFEAKRLLAQSGMSVAETAYHLGFDDPAYFSRFFTQHAGLSPRAFRQRHAVGEPRSDE